MNKTRKISEQEQNFWFEFTKNIKPFNKKNNVEKEEKTFETIISEEKTINNNKNNVRAKIDSKKAKEIKKKGLKTDAKLDLHGLTQDRAYNKLCNFIEKNWLNGVRNLLIITGKGNAFEGSGILKQMLPRWLAETKFNRMILHITVAKRKDGGDGAFYVVLRKRRENN